MKAVYIVVHPKLPNAAELLENVVQLCERYGIQSAVHPQNGLVFESSRSAISISQCDAVLSIGGDGTFLSANQIAYENHLPVIGINCGHIGFLTAAEYDGVETVIKKLKHDEYQVLNRMMLRVKCSGNSYFALNDAVITRGVYTRLIHLSVHVDQSELGQYHADGMIVCTPTGSTGYSLSAGGPIVDPDMRCMVITPICPHSLQHRPVIVSESSVISVQPENCGNAFLSLDGLEMIPIHSEDTVTVTLADNDAQIISINGIDFYNRIRYKLSEWSRS